MPSHRSDLALYLGVIVAGAALVFAAVQASSAAVTVPIAFALGVLVALVLYRVARTVRPPAGEPATAAVADSSPKPAENDPTDSTSPPSAAPAAPETPRIAEDVGSHPPEEVGPSHPPDGEPAGAAPVAAGEIQAEIPLETAEALARVDAAVRVVDPRVASVALWLFDPASATYRLVGAHGPEPPPSVPLDEGHGAVAGAGEREEPVLELERPDGEAYDEPRPVWRFAWNLPLGEGRGALSVDVAGAEPPGVNELARGILPFRPALAGSLALHIARDETRIVRALLEVARELSRSLREDRLLETALDRAMEMSLAATGSVMLADAGGRLRIATSRGLPESVVEGTTVSKGEGIAGWVFAMGEPLLVEDIPTRGGNSGRRDVRSAVSVPLRDEHGTLGVLNVGSRAYPARLTRNHVDALEIVGRQAAVALRNARAVGESRDLYFDTLRILAEAMERREPSAQGGTTRTLELVRRLASDVGMTPDQARAVEIAALFHDLGMSGVGGGQDPDRPLSTVERGLMTMHPIVAARLLEEAPALREVAPIVYHHHERYDGGGYVGGLSGEEIPLGARVLAVADAYVAMTSARPHRDALTPSAAAEALRESAGTEFDPNVVEVFMRSIETSDDRAEATSSGA